MDVFCLFVIKSVCYTIVLLSIASFTIVVLWFVFATIIEVIKLVFKTESEQPDSQDVLHKE